MGSRIIRLEPLYQDADVYSISEATSCSAMDVHMTSKLARLDIPQGVDINVKYVDMPDIWAGNNNHLISFKPWPPSNNVSRWDVSIESNYFARLNSDDLQLFKRFLRGLVINGVVAATKLLNEPGQYGLGDTIYDKNSWIHTYIYGQDARAEFQKRVAALLNSIVCVIKV